MKIVMGRQMKASNVSLAHPSLKRAQGLVVPAHAPVRMHALGVHGPLVRAVSAFRAPPRKKWSPAARVAHKHKSLPVEEIVSGALPR